MSLVQLILAHLLGDFALQPSKWVKDKEEKKLKSVFFYCHILLHGTLCLVFIPEKWWIAISVTLVHGTIDAGKLYLQSAKSRNTWFIVDQFAHICSLIIIWYMMLYEGSWLPIWQDKYTIILTALIFLAPAMSVIMRVLMSGWANDIGIESSESLQNAGMYIGVLERLFVFFFVLSGNLQAIGFLIAAKSVFRFGDLRESKNRKLTEYVLIGTLLSFGVAGATGVLVSHLI